MDAPDVERIVRSLLTHYALPYTVGGVSFSDGSWRIDLIDTWRAPLTVTVRAANPQSVRRAVMEALEVDG